MTGEPLLRPQRPAVQGWTGGRRRRAVPELPQLPGNSQPEIETGRTDGPTDTLHASCLPLIIRRDLFKKVQIQIICQSVLD